MAEEIIIRSIKTLSEDIKADFRLPDGRLHAVYDPSGRDALRLLETLSGHIPHTGTVEFDGREASTASYADCVSSGIGGMESVFGEYTLLDNLRLFLPNMSVRDIRDRAERYAFISSGLDLRKRAGSLSPTDMIRFRLLRSLIRQDRLILLSWPLSGLTDKEKKIVKPLLSRCAENRRQILYTADTVSDALCAQEITLMLHGSAAYLGPVDDSTSEKLTKAANRYAVYPRIRKETLPGGVLLAAKGIWVDKKPRIEDIRLEIREGEITGILYHPGSGETALADCLCARIRPDAGRMVYSAFHGRRPDESSLYLQGLKYIPPFAHGPVPRPEMNALEHTALIRYGSSLLWPGGMLDRKRAAELTGYLLDQFRIPHTPVTPLDEFSENEIRALSVAAQLNREGKALIAFDLFEGLSDEQTLVAGDILKKDRSHRNGILLFSTMASKLYPVSDRVFCLRDGVLIGS